MRTTVTIDADTEHLLKEEATRTGHSFKVVLNEAIRTALVKPQKARIEVEPLFDAPFPAEFEGVSLNHLPDLLDDEETLRELTR
ncbi:MAG: antitoxin [Opitutales bacterium]